MISTARIRAALAVGVAVAATVTTLAVGSSPAGATSCSITWGSLPKVDDGASQAPITNLRAGRHACFDRLVVDVSGQVDGWDVRYVSQVVQDGSGDPIPLRGAGDISVVVRTPAHDADGRPTYSPARRSEAVDVSGFSTFRQVAFGGTFEGQTTIGLGVRARLPLRVFVLAGPGTGSRLVIDVAHRW